MLNSYWITWQIDKKLKKCKIPIEYHGKLLLRPHICPLRTYGNSPLCLTGHWSFEAAALLSLHFFTGSLPAGYRVPLTMCDPWMTSFFLFHFYSSSSFFLSFSFSVSCPFLLFFLCFFFFSPIFSFSSIPSKIFRHAPFPSKQQRCTLQHNQEVSPNKAGIYFLRKTWLTNWI